MDIKIGLEKECHLIDSYGNIVNAADQLVADPDNEGWLLKECSKSVVEVIAPPSSDLREVHEYFGREVQRATQIAAKYGLRLLPSTTIGSDAKVEPREGPRYDAKMSVLGREKRLLEHHICGTHIHVDKLSSDKLSRQYQLMTALDPSFAFMSSSPYLLGTNSLQDARVQVYRNIVFANHALQGQLLPHAASFEEASDRQERTYQDWIELVKKHGHSSEGFSPLNTCWGPVKIAPRTLEARGSDANFVSRDLALAAVYKGISSLLDEQDPEVVIGSGPYLTLKDGTIAIPEYTHLKKLESAGIHRGLQDDRLHAYLTNMVNLASQGLPETERHFLDPFYTSLESRRTLSTDIVGFAKERGIYKATGLKDSAARRIRSYISNAFLQDLGAQLQ